MNCAPPLSKDHEVIRDLVEFSDYGAEHFKSLVYSENENTRKAVEKWCLTYFISFLGRCYYDFICCGSANKLDGNRTQYLLVVCQSGLLTCISDVEKRREAFRIVLKFETLPLANVLYRTGLVNNEDVEQCLRNIEGKEDARFRYKFGNWIDKTPLQKNPGESKDGFASRERMKQRIINLVEYLKSTTKPVKDFLRSRASQLRPLEEVCLLELSKQLGWGHVREDNLKLLSKGKAAWMDWLRFKDCEEWLKREHI